MRAHSSSILSIKYVLSVSRVYGQAKMKKPDVLRNVSAAFAVDYIPKKCRCHVFVQGNDVWVQHRDYFSPSMDVQERGAPLSVLVKTYLDKSISSKFIYTDAWGDIVLRNEAWINIENLKSAVEAVKRPTDLLKIWQEITRLQERYHGWDIYELEDSDMSRMWEAVVLNLHEQI